MVIYEPFWERAVCMSEQNWIFKWNFVDLNDVTCVVNTIVFSILYSFPKTDNCVQLIDLRRFTEIFSFLIQSSWMLFSLFVFLICFFFSLSSFCKFKFVCWFFYCVLIKFSLFRIKCSKRIVFSIYICKLDTNSIKNTHNMIYFIFLIRRSQEM